MLTEGHYRKLIERVQGRLAEATDRTLHMLERNGLCRTGNRRGDVRLGRSTGHRRRHPAGSDAAGHGIMMALAPSSAATAAVAVHPLQRRLRDGPAPRNLSRRGAAENRRLSVTP